MRRYRFEAETPHFLRPHFSGAVKGLIFANIVVFFIQLLFPKITVLFGLTPVMVIKKYFFWQLFTYMFLHGGFFHLFFNMFVLWMFGSELEAVWGRNEFLRYYFITGVGAGIVYVLVKHNSLIPTIGASGAVYGLLLAFGSIFPNRYVYLYFFLPIKSKYLVLVFGGIEFIAALSGSRDNVAHFAHLGGLLVGFLYLKFLKGKGRFFRRILFVDKKGENVDAEVDDTEFEDRLNDVLRKLSKVGLDGLSPYEKRILDEARKRYRNG